MNKNLDDRILVSFMSNDGTIEGDQVIKPGGFQNIIGIASETDLVGSLIAKMNI